MQFQGKPALARYMGVVAKCGKHTVIGGRFFRESSLVLLYHVIVIRGLPDREGKKLAIMKGRTVFDVVTGTASCVLLYSVQARLYSLPQMYSCCPCLYHNSKHRRYVLRNKKPKTQLRKLQDRQSTYNVTLRRIRSTVVEGEKQ